jgi:two-component system, NarL family, nitrate/nitrite response regulator NarL
VNNLAIPPINSHIQISEIRVFLVDDNQPLFCEFEKIVQGDNPPVRLVGKADTRSTALTGVIRQQPDIILLDYNLSNENSLDFLSHLAVLGRHRILVLFGQNFTRELSRQTIALGACGVVNKQSSAELLLHAIKGAYSEGHWSHKINPSIERRVFLSHH